MNTIGTRVIVIVLSIVCGALIGACASVVENTQTNDSESVPDESAVVVFMDTTMPECGYDMLGTVSVLQPSGRTPKAEAIDSLRNKAVELGGDGLINVHLAKIAATASSAIEWSCVVAAESLVQVLAGKVIRWSSNSTCCTRPARTSSRNSE